MKIKTRELTQKLNLKIINDAIDREISSGFVGDLLSWVLGKAKPNSAWITVMTNANVAAVAFMCDVSCVILSDGSKPDANLLKKVKNEGINLYSSEFSSYELCVLISKYL